MTMVDHACYPVFLKNRNHQTGLVITSPFQNEKNCFRLFCFHEFENGYPADNIINGVICDCGHQDGHHNSDGCHGMITHISIMGRIRMAYCGCLKRYPELLSKEMK